jgi:N-acyl-D-amino-acid deacylase
VDLIIRNGTVIDGTKAPRFEADVAVQDGRIAAVGNLAGSLGGRVSTRAA